MIVEDIGVEDTELIQATLDGKHELVFCESELAGVQSDVAVPIKDNRVKEDIQGSDNE